MKKKQNEHTRYDDDDSSFNIKSTVKVGKKFEIKTFTFTLYCSRPQPKQSFKFSPSVASSSTWRNVEKNKKTRENHALRWKMLFRNKRNTHIFDENFSVKR
jgi:hypothetical protein